MSDAARPSTPAAANPLPSTSHVAYPPDWPAGCADSLAERISLAEFPRYANRYARLEARLLSLLSGGILDAVASLDRNDERIALAMFDMFHMVPDRWDGLGGAGREGWMEQAIARLEAVATGPDVTAAQPPIAPVPAAPDIAAESHAAEVRRGADGPADEVAPAAGGGSLRDGVHLPGTLVYQGQPTPIELPAVPLLKHMLASPPRPGLGYSEAELLESLYDNEPGDLKSRANKANEALTEVGYPQRLSRVGGCVMWVPAAEFRGGRRVISEKTPRKPPGNPGETSAC